MWFFLASILLAWPSLALSKEVSLDQIHSYVSGGASKSPQIASSFPRKGKVSLKDVEAYVGGMSAPAPKPAVKVEYRTRTVVKYKAVPVSPETVEYLVRKGDKTWQIAKNRDTSVEVICALNGWTRDRAGRIKIDEKILVPAPYEETTEGKLAAELERLKSASPDAGRLAELEKQLEESRKALKVANEKIASLEAQPAAKVAVADSSLQESSTEKQTLADALRQANAKVDFLEKTSGKKDNERLAYAAGAGSVGTLILLGMLYLILVIIRRTRKSSETPTDTTTFSLA